DGLGNIYIAGDTRGNLDGTNAGSSDWFVSRYNAAGTRLWTRQIGSSDYDEGTGISADASGNVYVVGVTNGGTTAFLRKFNDAGTLQWSQQLPTDAPNNSPSVATDGLGNIYVAGNVRTSPGPPVTANDVFLSKYNDAGSLLWTRQFGSSGFES